MHLGSGDFVNFAVRSSDGGGNKRYILTCTVKRNGEFRMAFDPCIVENLVSDGESICPVAGVGEIDFTAVEFNEDIFCLFFKADGMNENIFVKLSGGLFERFDQLQIFSRRNQSFAKLH